MKLPFWPNPKGYRDIEFGLSRVYHLLERLDNPHQKLPPTIHIAGTNGKGSTLAFLRAIFEENSYIVHTYTSPHLVEFNERIILGGQKISDEFLNECLLECKNAAEISPKIEVTYFEGITVAAFLAFSKIKADILLLETGMGGRLDATNVIAQNLLSIITPIAFDHTEFLGDNLAKIAFEKAGIIKENCEVIIGKQEKEALAAIENQAKKLNSKIFVFARDFKIEINSRNWVYFQKSKENFWTKLQKKLGKFPEEKKLILPFPALSGSHQIENAAVAITAALTQNKFPIDLEKIKSALTKVFWPARLQKISSGNFYENLPKNFELILDGSHNLQGAATLHNFLKTQKKKKFLIFSMLQDKDCAGFLNEIKNEVDELIAIEIPFESKSRSAQEIFEIAVKLNIKCEIADNFSDAFAKILARNESEESLIVVCGSLYLAGSFLEENIKKLHQN